MATFALDTNDPYLVYPATGEQAVIANRDPTNGIIIARDGGLFSSQPSGAEGGQLTDPNVTTIDPGGYLLVDGTWPVYALAISGNPVVSVTPGASAILAGPSVIAAAIATSGLSEAIAQALAGTGISIIGSVTPLYGGQIIPPPTGASLVGAIVGYNLYGGNTYGSEQAAITQLTTYLNRNIPSQVGTFYMNSEGSWPTSVRADYQAMVNDGIPIVLAVKPAHTTSGVYTDTTKTFTGNTCLQEKTNLANFIALFQNAYVTAGFTAAKVLGVIPWKEPEGSSAFKLAADPNGHAHFAAMFTYYQTAITAAGTLRVYNPGGGKGEAEMGNYYPGDSNVDVCLADYYGEAFNNGVTLATLEALADNHLPSPIPFGLGEWNAAALSTTSLSLIQTYWNNYWNYILSTFSARLTAGKTNSWIMLYMGFNVGSGGSNPSPIVNDQINSASDFKIAGIQAINDALSTQSTASPTINPGNTYTVPPITPTAGGKFAPATQISYDISITLNAGAGSTVPWATVQLDWLNQDSTSAQPVATQFWACPMGTNGGSPTVINGEGPMRGQFLRVRITNKDSVACTLVNLMLNASGRNITKHNWVWDASTSVAIPTYSNLADGLGNSNSLGSVNAQSIPASGSKSWLFGLFTGEVYFRCNGDSGSHLAYVINPQPSGVWGSAALLNESPSGEFEAILIFPRAPVLVTVSNSDTVAHNANIEIIANN